MCCAQHKQTDVHEHETQGNINSKYCPNLYKEEMLYNMFEQIYKLASQSFNSCENNSWWTHSEQHIFCYGSES